MANSRIPADAADPRTFAEEPHITVCYGGYDKATGPNGADALLPFVQGGWVFIRHTVVTATDVVNCGDLPGNLAVLGVVNLAAVTALTTGTLALEAVSGGQGAHTLANAQALSSVGSKTTAPVLNLAPRKLTLTLAAATADDVITLAIQVCPLDKAYR